MNPPMSSPFVLPRILVADDDPSSQAVLRYLLADSYDVTIVGDGQKAIDLLQAQEFDLMLLDLQMPRANGFQVLQTLQANPPSNAMPVIVISAFDETEKVIQALHLGAKDYVNKPLDLQVLLARIETHLGLQRLISQQQSTIKALAMTRDVQLKLSRIISHDLKSPLTNFRIGHYMLREIISPNEEALRVIDNMEQTLNAIIDMIRVFVEAVNAQELRPKFGVVNTRTLVRDVVAQHQLVAGRKSIRLVFDAPEFFLWGDARMLNQALSNLVNNALKFSPADTESHLWVEDLGDRCRLYVHDQGPGIPQEEQDELFGMFSKLRNRPTAGESSTGLGLWIVRQLVTLHSGSYGVESHPDEGSTFWFEIPIATEEQITSVQPEE